MKLTKEQEITVEQFKQQIAHINLDRNDYRFIYYYMRSNHIPIGKGLAHELGDVISSYKLFMRKKK